MKKTSFFVGAIAVVIFSSCASGSAENDATATDTTSSALAPATAPDTSKSIWKDVNNAQTIPAATQPTAPSTTATTALNPAHGQPNHRCDIAVGAPLNSPPTQGQQTMPAASSLPAPAAQGSLKVNPAHGQPGHDCSVAVGAPLKAS